MNPGTDKVSLEKSIVRSKYLAENIVIVDGFPGCGKTLFGPIISSLQRVEIMQYIFEIEFICRLFELRKIDKDAAVSMVKMLSDHKLYQSMMGRDTNFRYSDLSSVFNYPNPLKYFKRIFGEGDMVIPQRINDSKPILSFVAHDLLAYGEPVFEALGSRLTFIEVVRHPLYMLIQQTLNMERLFAKSQARDIQIYFEYKGEELPYFCHGWEDLYLRSSKVDRAIYSISFAKDKNKKGLFDLESKFKEVKFIRIPFEKFVKSPEGYMKEISNSLNTNSSNRTNKALKSQNVPRKKVSEGIPLEIYKRCGWEPPNKDLTEDEELEKRRQWAVEMGASDKALRALDELSSEYIEENL